MNKSYGSLETKRLILRPMLATDIDDLLLIFTDVNVMAAFNHAPFTREQMQHWLGRNLDHQEEFGYGLFSVILKETGALIGDCGLEQMADMGAAELGYDFRSDFWNQGYATEAAQAVRDFAFEILQLPQLISLIRVGNLASKRVAEKVGMALMEEFTRYDIRYWKYALNNKKPDIIDIILSRRSIRQFTPQPVENESLILLLKAAMSAPTACNSQPWEFVVVTEQEKLNHIRDNFLFARYNAPAAIVVCGNIDIANNAAAREHWVQDCSAATENILIAAAGLGLGAVWIGVYPYPSKIEPLSQVMGIPENVTPLSMVMVGHPAERKEPRTQYDERRVYWQCYEPRKRRSKIKNAKYLP